MGSAVSWLRSFGVSMAIHALAAAAVCDRVLPVPSDARLRALVPVRLVWREPAPGPPAAAAPLPVAAVAPPSPPERASPPEPPLRVKADRLRRPTQRREPRAVATPAVPDAGSSAAGAATARPAPPADATAGGGGGGGAGDGPVALASVARPPEILERVVPEYPARARALELEGQVVLEVVLDREGRPEPAIRVLRSRPPFDAAAVAAVRRWRFRPARDADGNAVRVLIEIPVRFELR
ncbi:MAG: TonB family protein [Deltaproteobacteria bacterium]|nr:TonB family protein [Deltaproteobacteria bacterium]